jgi:hypothetical protein
LFSSYFSVSGKGGHGLTAIITTLPAIGTCLYSVTAVRL